MSDVTGRHERPEGIPPTPAEDSHVGAWGRLVRMARPRATKANALAAVLAIVLGFAIATQVHQTQQQGLESLRQSDLVRILDDVSQRSARLDTDARTLQATRDQLVSGSTNGQAAVKAARDRLDALGILAGTLPATGPGITLTIDDPGHKVTAPVLLDTLEELRDAGAEAVQVGPARVVASSYFSDGPGGVEVDGTRLSEPYTIKAIGDPQTMAAAMDIPGGINETVRQLGATPHVGESTGLRIDALQTARTPRYARPVSTPTPTQ